MSETKWLAKKIETQATYDANGVIINMYSLDGYNVKGKVNSFQTPSNKYTVLLGPDLPRAHVKAEQDINNQWNVVLDSVAKAADDAIKLAAANLKSAAIISKGKLKNIAATINAEPNLLPATKTALRDMLKVIRHLINEIN